MKAGDPSSCISRGFCKLALLYKPQGSLCLSSFCSTSAPPPQPFSALHLLPSDVCFSLIFIYSLFFRPGKRINRLLTLEAGTFFFLSFFLFCPFLFPAHCISSPFLFSLVSPLLPPPSSGVCLPTAQLPCSLPWPGTATR